MMKILKQSTLLLIGLFLLGIISCKKTDVTPTTENPLITSNASAASTSEAQIFRYQNTIDLSDPRWREYNACTGELINIIKGIWHIDFEYIINGNKFNFYDHSNVSSYKLINVTTGIEYTGSYVSNDFVTGNNDNYDQPPFETNGTLKILLTTSGGGNNGKLLVDYHFTVNAIGVITVDFYNYRAGCQ
jgi:hypothetical protein